MALTHSPTLEHDTRDDADDTPVSEEVLELVADEYAREILTALAEDDHPARDLVEVCTGSRPTVYRRLDRLEDAGLIESHTALHPDGHHRNEYTLAVDELTLSLADTGFEPA